MKTIITSGLLGSAVLLTSISTLHAEPENAVIVTATRTAQTVDESLASVTVITEADIQRSQATSLQDLLQGYAGLQFTNSGGAGKATSLFMRGTNSNHVLFMIDGIKTGSATSGTTAFQDIPVSQIERIEIVRGPRSSLYGSEAIGGVIQIFTKKGTTKTTVNAEAGYGSFNTRQFSAGFAGASGSSHYRLQASTIQTDGFDALQDTETDKDGYSNDSINIAFSTQFNHKTRLAINFLHAEGANEYDGSYENESETTQEVAGATLTMSPTDKWSMIIQTGHSKDESENSLNGIFSSRFNTKTQQSSLQNNFVLNTHNIFTFGLDYKKDTIDSTTSYNEKTRDNTGMFIQHQWDGQNNDLLIALRQDDNQTFGTHTTGNIAIGHQFNSKYRAVASYGTAFNAPTFNQLYYPDTGFGGGDPDLKPEESKTIEISLIARQNWGQWDINLYQTKINNMINGWPPQNVSTAEINGAEFRLSGNLIGLKHQLDISYVDPRNQNTNKILPRRSQQSLRYAIDKTNGAWQYGGILIAKGDSYEEDFVGNQTRVNGYGLINLHTSYAINKKWTLRAKLDNIFDEDYETVEGYNQPGINAFVSINYQGF